MPQFFLSEEFTLDSVCLNKNEKKKMQLPTTLQISVAIKLEVVR